MLYKGLKVSKLWVHVLVIQSSDLWYRWADMKTSRVLLLFLETQAKGYLSETSQWMGPFKVIAFCFSLKNFQSFKNK